MKSVDVLTWVVNQSISTDGLGFVPIDSEFDYESFFGYEPAVKAEEGQYLYVYGDEVLEVDIDVLTASTGEAPVIIRTPLEDRRNGGNMNIYLIKIDELK